MRVVCPRCNEVIPAEDINVRENVAFCRACDEGFPLDGLVGADAAPERVEKPPGTAVIVDSDPGRHLAIMLPTGGVPCGIKVFATIFALFWNGISWSVAVAAWMDDGWTGRLFVIPFCLIGVIAFAAALWAWFGRTSLAMDRSNLIMQWRLFGFTRRKLRPIEDITGVALAEAYRENDVPRYGVGIHLKSGSPIVFGSGLSDEEKKWLVWEIHDFHARAASARNWP
ncbi:MAG: hypothetical protein JW909_07645 [Planctomycetes bacterium]|nr:hypothetical protein [Planctomycetota bacterium]